MVYHLLLNCFNTVSTRFGQNNISCFFRWELATKTCKKAVSLQCTKGPQTNLSRFLSLSLHSHSHWAIWYIQGPIPVRDLDFVSFGSPFLWRYATPTPFFLVLWIGLSCQRLVLVDGDDSHSPKKVEKSSHDKLRLMGVARRLPSILGKQVQ